MAPGACLLSVRINSAPTRTGSATYAIYQAPRSPSRQASATQHVYAGPLIDYAGCLHLYSLHVQLVPQARRWLRQDARPACFLIAIWFVEGLSYDDTCSTLQEEPVAA
eukprot:364398-Chlamydomonas_euryale.AAC.3